MNNSSLTPLNTRYNILEDGVSIEFDLKKAARKVLRTLHTSITEEVDAIEDFNRGAKRGDTILVTGDRPRFALMRTFPEDKSDPDLIKLGDCRISLECGGITHWLDRSEDIRTVYKPSCTEYEIKLRQIQGLKINLMVSQAEDWGVVAKLSLCNSAQDSVKIGIKMLYGGIARHGRTFTAAYFDPDKDELSGNCIEIKENIAFLKNSNIPETICVWSIPGVRPAKDGHKASFHSEKTLAANESYTTCLIASRSCIVDLTGKNSVLPESEELLQEASDYYKKLLSQIHISTPSKILDSGLMNAVINLDYDYAGKLWLEGVHWWSSYWPDNCQISAALALGQLQRAKTALDFLGRLECGPCPALMASGKPFLNHLGVYNYGIEEGLPYYLYQLIQYYMHTGDKRLMYDLWDNLKSSIDSLFKDRDESKSGLLDWHLGCNGFLYQADHLAMPGDAASPSIMVAGLLEKLSEIAKELGIKEDAEKWKQTAAEMMEKLLVKMWNEEEGVFYNHIDYQGIRHMAHYYTDMVFPVLYADFPQDIKQKSLEALFDELLYETDDGLLLMRVGNFKPTIFGNDNVAPMQMCEAAKAFFMTGDNETGIRLIESTALSHTIYTEAPGNFNERMDDYGKGEANYIFGNPIGSYIYSVISGLFGMGVTDGGTALKCSPAFPVEWDHADLSLPYAGISFKKSRDGKAVKAVYNISSEPARRLEFSVLLDCENLPDIHCSDSEGEMSISEKFGKKKVRFITSLSSGSFEIVIKYIPSSNPSERTYKKHSKKVACAKSMELLQIIDKKTYVPLDITDCCNSDRIRAVSAWRNEDVFINLSGYENSDGMVEIEGIPFNTAKNAGSTCCNVVMALMEHSKSHPYTGKTLASDYPGGIKIRIGRNARGIALLYASECQSRQSGVDVGKLRLVYAGGASAAIALNVGKNLDSLFSHFAEDTLPVKIESAIQNHPGHPGTDYLNVLFIPCDSGKVLESIELIIELPDVQMGLIGLSLIL